MSGRNLSIRPYKHKSGAQKKKDQKTKRTKDAVGARSLFQVGVTAKNKDENEPKTMDDDTSDNDDIEDSKATDDNVVENTAEESTKTSQKSTKDIQTKTLDNNETGDSSSDSDDEENYFDRDNLTQKEIDGIILKGPPSPPPKSSIPRDPTGRKFPYSLFKKKGKNGEEVPRDWFVYDEKRQAVHCWPCRFFGSQCFPLPSTPSQLIKPEGYGLQNKDDNGEIKTEWRTLYDKVKAHEKNSHHIQAYLKWKRRELILNDNDDSGIDNRLKEQLESETAKWRAILKRIIDVVLYLACRGQSFQGDNETIGDIHNGNFLGIIELISHWDPVLNDHVEKVKNSQKQGKRLKAHYLSHHSQNEFIGICAQVVLTHMLNELSQSKYYAVIVDSTPDISHQEQHAILIRYVLYVNEEKEYRIMERFFTYIDNTSKTGAAIATLILDFLNDKKIPFEDCRGQGFDNAANMTGIYNGVQSHLLNENPLCQLCPCGCHTLNLCGVEGAKCCKEAVTLFGVVQATYTFFSSSPARWKILKDEAGDSLHGLSETRWSARISAIQPFARNLPGLVSAVDRVIKETKMKPKAVTEANGIRRYLRSFECILMSSIWFKILKPIDDTNMIIQARAATIDIEVANIKELISSLNGLRESYDMILSESQIVAKNLNIEPTMKTPRNKKRRIFDDDDQEDDDALSSVEKDFKIQVFNVILDNVINSLRRRFEKMVVICDNFKFLWRFREISTKPDPELGPGSDELSKAVNKFATEYASDVNEQELRDEQLCLKNIHKENINADVKTPLQLLNCLAQNNLLSMFPNTIIALRIFLTLPVTVASAERSFSKLGMLKNHLRNSTGQDRLVGLAILSLESDLAGVVDFKEVIDDFASKCARKANF